MTPPNRTAKTNESLHSVLHAVVEIAWQAGERILHVYERDFDVETKQDGSPLTEADRRSHELITEALTRLTPDVPVVSEESALVSYEERAEWSRLWLVDPLDGTKEFVKRNGEFTVNIALIEHGVPTLGVVHTPAQRLSHAAADRVGAFRITEGNLYESIATRACAEVTLVASRSHAGELVEQYRGRLQARMGPVKTVQMGSALKICLVAEGKADIYPRLGPTWEWDTAAAHCVLEQAGGRLVDPGGAPLVYNKQSLLNPWFFAIGDASVDWLGVMDLSAVQDVGS